MNDQEKYWMKIGPEICEYCEGKLVNFYCPKCERYWSIKRLRWDSKFHDMQYEDLSRE